MKVVRKEGGEYNDCIVKYFGFDKYGDDSEDEVFFWGWECTFDEKLKSQYSHYKKRILLDTSSPCGFMGEDPRYEGGDVVSHLEYFTHVYTICPFTAQILKYQTDTEYIPVCFPYPQDKFVDYEEFTHNDKRYDVMYYGQVHHTAYIGMLREMSKYKHRFTTISRIGLTDEVIKDYVTDYNLSSEQKWNMLANSKVCVGFNLLFLRSPHLKHMRMYQDKYDTTGLLSTFGSNKVAPQMKTRMIESAACKTLMLAFEDPYRVIEEWFTPNEHFIYWNGFDDLNNKLAEITTNYEKYWPIVENAHEHAKQYSVENFWRKINE